MTLDEIQRDIFKFRDYLEANGVDVRAFCMMTGGPDQSLDFFFGGPLEDQMLMHLSGIGDQNGLGVGKRQ